MKTALARSLAISLLFALTRFSLVAAATNVVFMGTYFFSPTNITINVGDTITWTNTASMGHDTRQQTNLWGSQVLSNQTFSFTFSNAGFYPYFCATHIAFHPEMTGTVSVVTAPNLPPTVVITNPPNATTFTAPANVTVQASVTNGTGSVTNVQFRVGATVISNRTIAPYAATTNALPVGSYTLTAIASDNLGLKATNNISISVIPPPSAVTILNPAFNGSSFSFSFATQVGYTYRGQFTASLSPTNWLTFTNLAGDGAVVRVTDSPLTNSTRYYRVSAN